MELGTDKQDEIIALLRKNNELLAENTTYLRRQERRERWGTGFKFLGFLIFLLVPIILYYYFFTMFEDTMNRFLPSGNGGAEAGTSFDLDQLQELFDMYRGQIEGA